eukprot:5654371-Alexandrium_andersonii.AAC.1
MCPKIAHMMQDGHGCASEILPPTGGEPPAGGRASGRVIGFAGRNARPTRTNEAMGYVHSPL